MRTIAGAGPRGGYDAKTGVGFTGLKALEYAGQHTAERRGYSYNKVFDVDVRVRRATELSYLIFPRFIADDLSYPSTYAAVDLAFTDGTYRRELRALDQHGARLSPRGQGARRRSTPTSGTSSARGSAAWRRARRSIASSSRYDNPDGPHDFRGWVDDITIDGSARAAGALAALGLGRDHARHQLQLPLLARQQHPRHRRAARLQLLDAGHQRRHAELALRVPVRQQRGEPAGARGVLAQPPAEPVDGRPPDLPGDALRGRRRPAAGPRRAPAAVPPRQRGRLAAPLRGDVRERHQDRDRAHRPRGAVPVHVPGRLVEPGLRQRRRRLGHGDLRRRPHRLDGDAQRALERRHADVLLRHLRPPDDRQRRALRALRRAHREHADRDVADQRGAGEAQSPAGAVGRATPWRPCRPAPNGCGTASSA